MPRHFLAIACTCLTLSCVVGDARAVDRNRLPDAVNRIERETGGRVLSAERRTRGGREVSRIKVYTPEGRVRIMWDDPTRDRDRERSALDRSSDEPRPRSMPERRPSAGELVQRGLRPEPSPLPESPQRPDDGAPGF